MLAFDSSETPPTTEPAIKKPSHGSESYLALVWRRLRRSWTGMAGLILVGLLLIMAIFADFFAPMDPKATDVGFAPPQVMSFHDKDGNFVFQPRVYALSDSEELDPVTFQPIVGMDYDNPRLLGFFVKGAEYKLLGLIPADRHFFGSTDRRIILQHIFPNVMSHVIVAVTLAIPSVVLLESFLGFLGFAVKPPLISWGLMLQDTATYSVIGSYPWILSPVGFVLVTVFAFNALGDGLRDAVDPY
ncbi:ABC transporter permease [Rhizobium hidalgonense]|uniref:ABC transporter permease n=1 Tax=Rhizobium hidalgonense TaxID=1538159 RepID=UPI000FEC66B1|nr:ABC transporter permease subunit [Rhizobium hidalgonense]RWX19728.1 ABC transporter permease [Rhizobium hidalgonense]